MILVTGANGVVGAPLCERLSTEGRAFIRVSRKPLSNYKNSNATALTWNLDQAPDAHQSAQLAEVTIIIHCAPIWLLAQQLESLKVTKLKRLIVFSSTSVISKGTSSDSQEQALVSQLAQAERAIADYSTQQAWRLTILRPSMIYGYGRDQNVAHIARFIRRYGVMFVVGKASGKRQPVHCDDLVEASLAIMDSPLTVAKTYNLAGGDVFSYREMVKRIFHAMGKPPRIVSLPLWLFRFGLRLASTFTHFNYTPEMANRMNQDLDYDHSSAISDFGYAPQGFLNNPQRDLADPK